MDLTQVGARIREARKAQSMTQEELAEKCGIAAGHMGIIERGVKTPQLDNFIAICNALQVSADQLLQDVVDVSTTYTSNEVAKRLEQLPMDEQRKILRANWQTLSANGKKPTPEEFIVSCALKMLSGRLANDRLKIRDP